jgi:lantibiotic biosynthesis protein
MSHISSPYDVRSGSFHLKLDAKVAIDTCAPYARHVVELVAANAFSDAPCPVGELIFLIEMFLATNEKLYLQAFVQQIEATSKSIQSSFEFNYFNSANLLSYLLKQYPQLEGSSLLESVETLADTEMDRLPNFLDNKNFDFVFGASGLMAARTLARGKRLSSTEYQSYFKSVVIECSQSKFGLVPTPINSKIGKIWAPLGLSEVTNLGFAHGNLGVMASLALVHTSSTPESFNISSLLEEMLTAYISRASLTTDCVFGPIVESYSSSPLGWCYGDLSAAVVLTKLRYVTNALGLQELLTRLLDSVARRLNGGYVVKEFHMCHGKAGLWWLVDELEASDFCNSYFSNYKSHILCELNTQLERAAAEDQFSSSDFLDGFSGACLTLLAASNVVSNKVWQHTFFPFVNQMNRYMDR